MRQISYGLLLILLFLFSSFLWAGTTGKIVGVVKDKASGEPLIGVNITLEGTTLGASTDMDGTFIILNIPPGTYTIVAQYIGYANVRMENVKVNVDFTTELTIPMGEQVLTGEEVTVVANREMVTKDLTASTATVDAERIQALPITEISEALELQGGYLDGHVRGGRSGEVAYWIDGMPVTDSYDGGQIVEVNKDMVEQLQFISGAFNAEYGQAMSGVVNITTKEPSERFGGNITLYAGDYYSGNSDIFWNTNNFDPTNIYNIEGGIFGSIVPKKLSYYVNGRYIYFGGWQYGRRVFNPQNVAYYTDEGDFVKFRDAQGVGNGEYVPMNWNRKIYSQGKLIYNISPVIKTFYSFIRDDVNFEEYDRNYKLNPAGNLNRYRTGYTHLLKLSHTVSNRVYYDLGVSYYSKSYEQYVYEDPFDTRYIHPWINDNQLLYNFKTGGTNNQHFIRDTKTALLKFDLTSQINKRHLVKGGVEARRNDIFFDDITLRPSRGDAFDRLTDSPFMEPAILPVITPFHSQYSHQPIELSVYLQDKMEFEDLIVNIGVRVDHFRPDAKVLADPADPNVFNPLRPEHRYHDLNNNGIQDAGEPNTTLAERLEYWYKDAGNKTQFSPRLGISFPITATGIIHFSYGHFFQIPNFELLYRNPQFRLGTGTENQGIIGNANLEPEQTI
ncbi:MAG: carboxypeptidase-like regulatory domain-containing protein, partial [Calditrichia bacterium]